MPCQVECLAWESKRKLHSPQPAEREPLIAVDFHMQTDMQTASVLRINRSAAHLVTVGKPVMLVGLTTAAGSTISPSHAHTRTTHHASRSLHKATWLLPRCVRALAASQSSASRAIGGGSAKRANESDNSRLGHQHGANKRPSSNDTPPRRVL